MPNLYWLQGYYHIDQLIWFQKASHFTSHLLRHLLEALRIELGCNGNLLALPYHIFGVLASATWVLHTWTLKWVMVSMILFFGEQLSVALCIGTDKKWFWLFLNILGKFIVGHPGLLPIKGWFDGCSGQIWIDKVLAPHFANTLQSNMPTHYNPSYWIDHFSVHHSGAFVTAVNDWVPTLISYLLGTRASSNLLTLESTNSWRWSQLTVQAGYQRIPSGMVHAVLSVV